ncbi:MAG: NAD(P)(+) transhydrogenase (Re/Si-specific) subunit alpha [Alphaproteobacteria bacterium]|nr:NAD(P)(+) transhydrogenase (Re/Si-specific) subunit alpha [Alphaproteobacteria bacterium]MBE6467394.1 NAD(P)(+) transhydrogenase (Re/Si-specific) subunit alpha [Alphaproteobacteria bacterium]
MIIGILRETNSYENRVCVTPQSVKKYIAKGLSVIIETNAGANSCFNDEEYISSGATIKRTAKEILQQSDILLKINPPTFDELKYLKKSTIIIGNFQHSISDKLLNQIHQKSLFCFALEKLPRISRTQSFDILSSQDNLSGYQAVLKACDFLKKSVPMMITSAGTLPPVNFLILGIGVAGLQAIATAKRLGGKVFAHDIRPETKEQAQSLGAIFVENINDILPKVDVVIACASSPAKKAPVLIKKTTIKNLKKGSVLIDMSISSGGNIEGSQIHKVINIYNCLVYADSSLANQIPQSASVLYANNLSNFIEYLNIGQTSALTLNKNDEIIKSTLL